MTGSDSTPNPAGWVSDLPTFRSTQPRVVRLSLESFVRDAGPEQLSAWDHWIPRLQRATDSLLQCHEHARSYTAILEYELPRDLRRPDVIVLEQDVIVVLELKGSPTRTRAGLDQVLAYARDLRAYHAACHDRPVVPVLVPSTGPAQAVLQDGAWIVGPSGIHRLLEELARTQSGRPIDPAEFLREDAYAPLPTIVQAARELFEKGDLPFIKRARASTDPALRAISAIAHEAASTRTRHLVLVTGVPGSGKTLVGLQLVHAHWLDDLAVSRSGGKPASPAVFLSGNGPLVDVLQDALKSAGGGGRTFVQGIKNYVKTYRRPGRVPPEHLIVFDEAQRAHDAERSARVHGQAEAGLSEPEHLLEFLRRVPEWCVLVALIGTGQAIHQGEEGGLPLWRAALESCGGGAWTVHAPSTVEVIFAGTGLTTRWNPALNLDTEIRHHMVPRVHAFVEALLDRGDASAARAIAEVLHVGAHRFLLTRDLHVAMDYLRERYGESRMARYGMLASSKDKILPAWEIDNTFQTTKQLRVGSWYNAPGDALTSCCRLDRVATEFSAQGLELDMALLAWGSDFRREGNVWSISGSRGTRGKVNDPVGLRRNSYRVLLTRGRDGTVVYVPRAPELDETHAFLEHAGMRRVDA